MQKIINILCIALAAIMAGGALAGEVPAVSLVEFGGFHSVVVNQAKTVVDTIQIMGPHRPGATWSYFGDFQDEHGYSSWNGWTAHDLTVGDEGGAVGLFANLLDGLADLDPCRENATTQVNFVDTGFYIDQGLDPQPGLTWCYGPGCYIVQNQGGLTFDPSQHLHNAVRSPIMPWPDPANGNILVSQDVYLHTEFGPNSALMLYELSIRSTASSDPNDIELAGFQSDGYMYFGPAGYRRLDQDLSSRLVENCTYVQIQMSVLEYNWLWPDPDIDGTPAPYLDNVSVRSYSSGGPALYARSMDLAQDAFPTIGRVDTENLASNSVRFDMAADISPHDGYNDPGDSLVVEITTPRPGAFLARPPRMYFALKANPIFDAYRTNAPTGDYVEGVEVVPDHYAFDLPDEQWLFPGDVLHYYFEAVDDLLGDQAFAILPADTSCFGNFERMLVYDSDFTFRALPSLRSNGMGFYTQPRMLFWNDYANRGGENEWLFALRHNVKLEGQEFDIYYTHAPSAGQGNGLGGRATLDHISGYTDMLYTSGTLGVYTMSNGDGTGSGDKSDDLGLLRSWLELGGRDLFMTGDNLISDLENNSAGAAFIDDFVGVEFLESDIQPLINGQYRLLIKKITGNPVFYHLDEWLVWGDCPVRNKFDAVYPAYGAVRLAEFTDSSGQSGMFDYSAATLFANPTFESRVISMPYDFMTIWTIPGPSSPMGGVPDRALLMLDVLTYFGLGMMPGYVPSPVPDADVFSAGSYPNPFNPACRIAYNLPQRGHLGIKVYNIRGEVVRTLIDEIRDAGAGHVTWDGKNDAGAAQASGVYFYEARADEKVVIDKMTLVK